jgi:hypothetical protein
MPLKKHSKTVLHQYILENGRITWQEYQELLGDGFPARPAQYDHPSGDSKEPNQRSIDGKLMYSAVLLGVGE